MPRPYRLERRQAAVEQTRARILEATRELLMKQGGFSGFTVEAVARQADVARMTIYYQFGSKVGLLEALCDRLAAQGGMERLAEAFHEPEPLEALDHYIRVFARFWASDRLVTRRLRALATLDPDFERVIKTRDGWRRNAVSGFVKRIREKYDRPTAEALPETINILWVLLGFETFDALAGPDRGPEEVVDLVIRLAHSALGFTDA